MRPDLVEIVRIFARRHIPLLYTNGWYVDDPKARALWDAGLAQVGVSIDYATRRIATTGAAVFPAPSRARGGPSSAFATLRRTAEGRST